MRFREDFAGGKQGSTWQQVLLRCRGEGIRLMSSNLHAHRVDASLNCIYTIIIQTRDATFCLRDGALLRVHPCNIVKLLPAPICLSLKTKMGECRPRSLQLQLSILILTLHLQNFTDNLQALGNTGSIANCDELGVCLLQLQLRLLILALHFQDVAETSQALGSPESIANCDELGSCLLQLQLRLLILVPHFQGVAEMLQAIALCGVIEHICSG